MMMKMKMMMMMAVTHSEGVGLLPGDREAPVRRQTHFIRQRLGNQEEHEGDVGHGDHRGNQHHQAVAVA